MARRVPGMESEIMDEALCTLKRSKTVAAAGDLHFRKEVILPCICGKLLPYCALRARRGYRKAYDRVTTSDTIPC